VIRLLLALCLLFLTGTADAAELKLSTWNLEWLTLRPQGDPVLPSNVVPKTEQDRALLRRYALMLDADVVAFQEVDGPEAAAQIFPPDRYAIYMTQDRVVQRVGFAVRRGLTVRQNPDLVALDVNPNAPFRLRSGADITLDVQGNKLRLLNVHLKSGCHEQSLTNSGRTCATLRRQLPALQGWIAQRVEEGVPFLLMGDFNRRMDRPEELLASLNQVAPLARATEGRGSSCWGGSSFIDHILAGGAARAWMRPDTLRVLIYREGEDMKDHLSDHCPVSVRLTLPE
jgi:endonuclease/exonuclease/phosphatase family metal-dependent hydrolase